MEDKPTLLDLTNSKLILQGNKTQQKLWSKKIDKNIDDLKQDKQERTSIYRKRKDFYRGEQADYSNINGIVKDTKNKKGHTNQVTNYAGKTIVKMSFAIANNPPKLTTTPTDINDEVETIRTQAVEEYIDSVFDSKDNRFWRKTYRRGAFIQGELGDFAIKTFINPVTKEIKVIGHDDMESIVVGWNGNAGDFDFVSVENYLTPQLVEELYGIVVNQKALTQMPSHEENKSSGSWSSNNLWLSKNGAAGDSLPTGKNKLPKVKVIEYDSQDVYAIKIEGELVQLIIKDDVKYPKVKMWTFVSNIPNPPSPWSIADIDYLMDAQIELNENDNRSSDHLRVGNVQRYVAYNLSDFDPESIKTTSGQVIFVDDPDGKARFEPLQTNINNFPDDQYNTRKLQQIYDMGLPKVNYGASNSGSSGRSMAIDYQSSVDLTQFKRDAWELALQDVCEKIQIYGNYLLGDKLDWFTNKDRDFIVRNIEFDWNDILPISQGDKIVNVANKYNMIGIPLEQAYKELGYRNPKAMIDQLKKELNDPLLMTLRSKAWALSPGLIQAEGEADAAKPQDTGPQAAVSVSVKSDAMTPAGQQILQNVGIQGGGAGGSPGQSGPSVPVNQAAPMLNSSQNDGSAKPMASKGGTTAVSSASGVLKKAQQNMAAGGK